MKLPVAQLTPWVGALSSELEAALAGLFGGGVQGRGVAKAAQPWSLLLRLEASDLQLELAPAQDGAPAFVRGGGLAVSYRKRPDGTDPYVDAEGKRVLQGIAERVRALSSDAATEVLAAVERYRGASGAQDFMLRSYDAARKEGNLRLGFRCNQDCGFCWQSRRWPDPPESFYQTWLDELANLGATRLVISGGEPTLHAGLAELLLRATKVHGMHVCLETNAMRLRNAEYLQGLKQAGLGEVFVSLHSHDAARSDALTRAPGTHEKTLAGVRACLAADLAVTLNCVILRETVGELGGFAAFVCEELTATERVVFSQPSAAFDLEYYNAHSPHLSTVRAALPGAIARLRRAGIEVECVGTCGFPPCTVPEFPELWRSLGAEQVAASAAARHEFAAACDGCAARARCLGLRTEYRARHGDSGIAALTQFDP
ncbi:MAG TPA: radical SAM protein [Polyangiaceae bacterium]|nr:radical SAM protein [Polyangiaceae bacterium]